MTLQLAIDSIIIKELNNSADFDRWKTYLEIFPVLSYISSKISLHLIQDGLVFVTMLSMALIAAIACKDVVSEKESGVLVSYKEGLFSGILSATSLNFRFCSGISP